MNTPCLGYAGELGIRVFDLVAALGWYGVAWVACRRAVGAR